MDHRDIPDTSDIIINVMVKHIVDLIISDEDSEHEESALYSYIELQYELELEHDLPIIFEPNKDFATTMCSIIESLEIGV